MKKVTLTKQGYESLQKQLEGLKKRREEAIARIQRAREFGDLSENSEYDDARDEQSFIEGKIKEIENTLRNAEIVEAGACGGQVILGCKVTVEQDGELAEYNLVGANESNPASGKISIDSPIGKALLGKKEGDIIKTETPGGLMEFKIKKIN